MLVDEYPLKVSPLGYEIDTKSEDAQTWFNRGLNWAFAFNHNEAIFCFTEAYKLDPECPMAYFGIAWMMGPNYNVPEIFPEGKDFDDPNQDPIVFPSAKPAFQAITRARELVDKGRGNAVEAAVINAMQKRIEYPYAPGTEARARLNEEFHKAVTAVHEEFPDDPLVTALYTEALMQLSPWDGYDKETFEPKPNYVEAQKVVREALSKWPEHVGFCHYYIHLMEMSPHPEEALELTEPLRRGVFPDSGHLLHMPTHLDVLLGRFDEAIKGNKMAVEAEAKNIALRGPVGFMILYRMHNMHFLVYTGMMMGNFQTAEQGALKCVESTPPPLLQVPEMADWLEVYQSLVLHVYVRFGKWETILEYPEQEDKVVYSYYTALRHYARTVAFASLDRVPEAEAEYELLLEATEKVQPTRKMFQNPCSSLLELAQKVAKAEITYRKGEYEGSISLLEEAVALDDNLNFDEPWGWMLPARHPMGAFMVENKDYERAEAVYRRDLRRAARGVGHPKNIWALRGLYDCLVARGDASPEVVAEREEIKAQIDALSGQTDVDIKASCMCATRLVQATA